MKSFSKLAELTKIIFAATLCFMAASNVPIAAQENQYVVEENRIVLTTAKTSGEWKILLLVTYSEPDDGHRWIDWNNDGSYQAGEEIVPSVTEVVKHAIESQTITIYGNYKYLLCSNMELTSADLKKCPALTTVNLTRNLELTKLRK